MKIIYFCLLYVGSQAATLSKEKPSIMIGIKRSTTETTEKPVEKSTENPERLTPEKLSGIPEKFRQDKPSKKPTIPTKKPTEKPPKERAEEITSLADVISSSTEKIELSTLAPETTSVEPCKNGTATDVYDNSQTGTENYRVHVKGFTFLLAPHETVLGAAMVMSGLGEMKSLQPVTNQAGRSESHNQPLGKLLNLMQRLQRNRS